MNSSERIKKKRVKEDVISLFNTVEFDVNYNYKEMRGKRNKL